VRINALCRSALNQLYTFVDPQPQARPANSSFITLLGGAVAWRSRRADGSPVLRPFRQSAGVTV
jgi:hypothetical protein